MELIVPIIFFILQVAGMVILPSQLLIVRFWLWRQRGRKTAFWSFPLGLAWLLFLIGISGLVLDVHPDDREFICLLCIVAGILCLWIALPIQWWQGYWWRVESEKASVPGPPILRDLFQLNPVEKRFALQGYALSVGLPLLIWLGLFVTHLVLNTIRVHRMQAIITLIQNGTLRPSHPGDVTLPHEFASETVNGHVYFGQVRLRSSRAIVTPHNAAVYFFPTDIERFQGYTASETKLQWSANMEGYVCLNPPEPDSFYQIDFSGTDLPALYSLDSNEMERGWYYATTTPEK